MTDYITQIIAMPEGKTLEGAWSLDSFPITPSHNHKTSSDNVFV